MKPELTASTDDRKVFFLNVGSYQATPQTSPGTAHVMLRGWRLVEGARPPAGVLAKLSPASPVQSQGWVLGPPRGHQRQGLLAGQAAGSMDTHDHPCALGCFQTLGQKISPRDQ